jgi:uncharacterized ferritin-like protein (DUF455 family)
MISRDVPPEGTVEQWAFDYVASDILAHKLAPPPVPLLWEDNPPVRRIERPGRPCALDVVMRAPKAPGPDAMRDPVRRAELVHTFLHHELQAAELMCWALLAFPDAPRAFKKGLVRITLDEIRHMRMYLEYMETLGRSFGDFPVRDWFWERVPQSPTPAHFVAVMGMGFEGGNLDHTVRFEKRFAAIGDAEGARIQAVVCAEEIPHVRFAVRWFKRFTQGVEFENWRNYLPQPLSPMVMRGTPQNKSARLRAGYPEAFLTELEQWVPDLRGS